MYKLQSSVLLLFCFVCSLFNRLEAQTKIIDSLKLCLTKSGADTNRVNILYRIGEEYWKSSFNYDSTFKYTDSARKLAQQTHFILKEIDANLCLANITLGQGDKDKALSYLHTAVDMAKATGNKEKLAEAFLQIAFQYRFYSDLVPAFDYAYRALAVAEKTGNNYLMGESWYVVGLVYSWQNNGPELENSMSKALNFFQQSGKAAEEEIASCNHFLARANMLMKNYDTALNFSKTAIEILEKSGKADYTAGSLQNMGYVYTGYAEMAAAKGDKAEETKMYNIALENFKKALKLADEKLHDLATSGDLLHDIAGTYIRLGQYKPARVAIERSLKICRDSLPGPGDGYKEFYKTLSIIDSAEGNTLLAYKEFSIYTRFMDSVTKARSLLNTELAKTRYEFNRNADSTLKKQLLTETRLKAQRKQKFLYIAGLALLTVLSYFIFQNYKNQKKVNKLETESHLREKNLLEVSALKAQMNPHFMFNCINSIDSFIQTNDKYNATLYLNKFAKLIRNVLDSSKHNVVPFHKDIETLKLYIELEELRHENKFKTKLDINEELLYGDYFVPPLIIQPFVENAILHGLKNQEGNNGLLHVQVQKQDDKIHFIITDNGIGREAARQINQTKETHYGMQMSFDRIKLFNNETTPSVNITDITVNNQAAGTKVEVWLKTI